MDKPETTTTTILTPFWYRRVCEVTWLLTAIVTCLWAITTNSPDIVMLEVPPILVTGALIASFTMLFAYIRLASKSSPYVIKLGYVIFFLASLYAVTTTGHVDSPYMVLWLFICIFPAIFGLSIFIPVVILANIYLIYLYVTGIVSINDLLISVIALELPLVMSLLIWRRGTKHIPDTQADKDPSIKALAKELSQVSNQSEIVINAIADGVLSMDGGGVVQLVNPAAQRIIGWGVQDALSLDYRSVLQLFDAKNQSLSDELDPIRKCLRTNAAVETDELQLATTSGKKLSVSLLVSPIGQLGNGAIVVFRDITAQRAEERQQAEFISTASHEMRTPVAAIEGYIGLALNPATATIDDKAKIYLGKAHESAQHLGRLFQDLLDISKAEDGRLDNDPRVIDLVEYIRDITLNFNHMASTKGLGLHYKPDVDASDQRIKPAIFVNVDADHIREVTANLIENAIKYTKDGNVTIDVVGNDERTEITITDTGIGIPQEDISHLFQKFYRVDNTDTREIGGTGLGLYLCRRLIETVGGRIWVTSDFGQGSTFHVELPRMKNIDAVRELEASANVQANAPKLRAKASFLASEEEAAAIRQAATPSNPIAHLTTDPATAVSATPTSTASPPAPTIEVASNSATPAPTATHQTEPSAAPEPHLPEAEPPKT